MKSALSGALLAACVALSGCATSYGGGNLGGIIGGQGITRIDDDSWEIRSTSNGFSRADFGRDSAIYKAAILTVAAGYTHLQVYNFSIRQDMTYGHQYAKLRFHMVNDANGRFACESNEYFRSNCRTLSAREAIIHFAPLIPQTAEQAAEEVRQMRARYGFTGPVRDSNRPAASGPATES